MYIYIYGIHIYWPKQEETEAMFTVAIEEHD